MRILDCVTAAPGASSLTRSGKFLFFWAGWETRPGLSNVQWAGRKRPGGQARGFISSRLSFLVICRYQGLRIQTARCLSRHAGAPTSTWAADGWISNQAAGERTRGLVDKENKNVDDLSSCQVGTQNTCLNFVLTLILVQCRNKVKDTFWDGKSNSITFSEFFLFYLFRYVFSMSKS